MMFNKLLILPIILFFGFAVFAQTPSLPFEDRGACPFECCVYRTWVANKPTVVRSKRNVSDSTAFTVKRGERITALTGVVITTQYGTLKVLSPAEVDGVRVKAGETLYLLTYQGEGFYKAWYKGRLLSAGDTGDGKFKITRQPKSIWWVKVRNKNGKVGWTNLPENFGNKDQCG
jgi:hypothetical protein